MPTLNFRQVSINTYRNLGYLAQTTPASAGSSTGGTGVPGLTTSVAPSGTLLFMHTAIYDAGDINLRLAFAKSTVPVFTNISTGSGATLQQVQLIDQSGIQTTPEVSLRDGETLVLVGVSQNSLQDTGRISLLSGSKALSGTQQLQIMMITPRLDGSAVNSASR